MKKHTVHYMQSDSFFLFLLNSENCICIPHSFLQHPCLIKNRYSAFENRNIAIVQCIKIFLHSYFLHQQNLFPSFQYSKYQAETLIQVASVALVFSSNKSLVFINYLVMAKLDSSECLSELSLISEESHRASSLLPLY